MSKITITEHLKAVAMAAKQYTSGLVGDLAKTVLDAMNELESVKANKPSVISVTIPINGWNSDSNTSYPYYYDILVAGITIKDRAEITIEPDSLKVAIACGLCPTNETLENKIRLRATIAPVEAILAEYWIENGKE